MAKYAMHVSKMSTPQTSPIPGREADMTKNAAGGFSFAVKPMDQLLRFLILGNEGGTYYAGEREMTVKNVACLDQCLKADVDATIELVVNVSKQGRAPKNAPAVFCMAYMVGLGGDIAAKTIPRVKEVCRIPTDLFDFMSSVKQFCNLGSKRVLAVIKDWYTSAPADKLAYHVTKYQQRNGWSHADLLALGHPSAPTPAHNAVYRWCVAGPEGLGARQVLRIGKDGKQRTAEYPDVSEDLPKLFSQIKEIQAAKNPKVIAGLVRKYNAVREVIPTEALNSVEVWEALLESMPLHAMIRNLGKMTSIGMLKPLGSHTRIVCDRLRDAELIKRARQHPLNTLMAHSIYNSGSGIKGSLSWAPVPQIVQALSDCFYLGFDAVEPTKKNFLYGIDVSGSMGMGGVGGTRLTPAQAAAAMVMVGIRTEPHTYTFGFASTFRSLPLTRDMSLQDVLQRTTNQTFGATDCSVPMKHAMENKLEVDAFVVLTDNETYAGTPHPSQALKNYRQRMGRDAKLIVVGMTATNCSIADPSDGGMVDICGFDTSVPSIMSEFVRGAV